MKKIVAVSIVSCVLSINLLSDVASKDISNQVDNLKKELVEMNKRIEEVKILSKKIKIKSDKVEKITGFTGVVKNRCKALSNRGNIKSSKVIEDKLIKCQEELKINFGKLTNEKIKLDKLNSEYQKLQKLIELDINRTKQINTDMKKLKNLEKKD